MGCFGRDVWDKSSPGPGFSVDSPSLEVSEARLGQRDELSGPFPPKPFGGLGSASLLPDPIPERGILWDNALLGHATLGTALLFPRSATSFSSDRGCPRPRVSQPSPTSAASSSLSPSPLGHRSLRALRAPMELPWIPLLSILAFPRQTASDTTELIGALGSSVTFRSRSQDSGLAFWDFEGDPIVAVSETGGTALFSEGYKERFSLSESGRELIISQLRMEDAGTYSMSINSKKSTFTLQVYRELAEPTVTCEARNCSGGNCSFSLRCSAPGTGLGNVSYTWRVSRWRQEGESVVLLVQESSGWEPEPLTCTARNAVSSRNVSVSTAGMLCAGAASGSWVGIGLGAGLGVGLGVGVGLLIFLVLLSKSKGWKKFRLSKPEPRDTAESITVYAEVGPCQQRVPKAGAAGAGSSSTVYSLVKRPEPAGDGTVENGAVTGLELV